MKTREAQREYWRAYYAAHRERRLEQSKAYAAKPEARARISACSRTWAVANREKSNAACRRWDERNRDKRAAHRRETLEQRTEYNRGWIAQHPGYAANRRAANPEKANEGNRIRREAKLRIGRPYVKMEPWPDECQICGEPVDLFAPRRSPLGCTVGHEPPLAWIIKNLDYLGLLVLRPEHFSCNSRKRARPDWDL